MNQEVEMVERTVLLDDFFWAAREIETGIIAAILFVMSLVLIRYIWNYRKHLWDAHRRDARSIACGLSLLFVALWFRAAHSWFIIYTNRRGIDSQSLFENVVIDTATVTLALIGSIYCLRGFHPFPVWLILLMILSIVPFVLFFLPVDYLTLFLYLF